MRCIDVFTIESTTTITANNTNTITIANNTTIPIGVDIDIGIGIGYVHGIHFCGQGEGKFTVPFLLKNMQRGGGGKREWERTMGGRYEGMQRGTKACKEVRRYVSR